MTAHEFGLLFNAARDLSRSRFIAELSPRDYAAALSERIQRSDASLARVQRWAIERAIKRAITAPRPPDPCRVFANLRALAPQPSDGAS